MPTMEQFVTSLTPTMFVQNLEAPIRDARVIVLSTTEGRERRFALTDIISMEIILESRERLDPAAVEEQLSTALGNDLNHITIAVHSEQ